MLLLAHSRGGCPCPTYAPILRLVFRSGFHFFRLPSSVDDMSLSVSLFLFALSCTALLAGCYTLVSQSDTTAPTFSHSTALVLCFCTLAPSRLDPLIPHSHLLASACLVYLDLIFSSRTCVRNWLPTPFLDQATETTILTMALMRHVSFSLSLFHIGILSLCFSH